MVKSPYKNLLVVNTQSFGDILLSTHIGRISKKYFPEMQVHIAVRKDLTLTTAEKDRYALMDMLYIFACQDNIKSSGIIEAGSYHPIFHKNLESPNLGNSVKVLLIQGWSSDLGILKSQLKPFYDEFGIQDEIDTETDFTFESSETKNINSKLTVGLPGDLDFLRKWHNKEEYQKFLDQVSNSRYNIDIIKFGVDIANETYATQLKKLYLCDLVISPMGSLIHAAAGLGIDTISLTSVFPSEYDCPEFYHSGWHRSIKNTTVENHCKSYTCVTNKPYDQQISWGNPETKFGFWPKECPFTKNKMSCNFNITAEQIIEKFNEWYNENRKI